MSERAFATAAKAAITTVLQQGTTPPVSGPDARPVALDFDDAQNLENGDAVDLGGGVVLTDLPPIHVLVTITRRFGGNPRVSAHKTVTGWRLTTTVVGTTVDEARWAFSRIAQLEYVRLTATGSDLSPLMFESANAPEPDDGMFSAMSSWTFTSTPTP